MPVLAKFYGIVIRMLCLRSLGARLHAFYGDAEMVIDLSSLRVVDGDLPAGIRQLVMAWAEQHQASLMQQWQPIVFTPAPSYAVAA